MKRASIFTLLCCLLSSTTAPLVTDCQELPTAMIDLEGNGIRARITTGGDLWFDGNNGRYHVTEDTNPATLNSPSAAFAGGLWMAGRDPGGGLKVAAQAYGRNQGNFDYRAGPLDENGNNLEECAQWDRFWKVTSAELRAYLNDFDPNNPVVSAIPASFRAWPGLGNPLFAAENGFELPNASHGYAPFFDVNADGTYDPQVGDYPLFCGDQAIWCIFNDAGLHEETGTPNQIQAEVQLLAYSYEAAPEDPLRHTTFYDYKIVNRAFENIQDFYAGLWIDFDLGCFTDDYLGSIPENNLVYVHNDRGTDEPFCDQGVRSFTSPGVVQIAQVVNASVGEGEPLLSSFATINNAALGTPAPEISDPATADEYYNYMQGQWRDGTPITRGGDGYNVSGTTTRYAFDGGPLPDGTPWLSCNENLGFRDLRGVLSTGPYDLQPQEVATFTVAMTTIFDVDFPEVACPDTAPIIAAATAIKDIYDGFCSPDGLVDTEEAGINALQRSVFPNPTSGEVTFEVPASEQLHTIELLDAAGRLVSTITTTSNRRTVALQEVLPQSGLYLYRLRTASGKVANGRLVFTQQ